VFVGSGPDAEFFEVVTHGGVGARMVRGGATQELRRFSSIVEWNQVAQSFQSGQEFYGVALVFDDVVAVELVEFESRAEKMIIVDKRVIHVRGSEGGGELRLPDTFGEPGAVRSRSEMFLNVIGEPRNLFVAVIQRNRGQDGLVKSTADDFHLAALHECAQKIEIFRVGALKPLE
jgi:hypothetical protein